MNILKAFFVITLTVYFNCLLSNGFSILNLPNEDLIRQSNDSNFKIWAVLVAGSNTWSNYRHQADVCHAYQVLIKHGVHPDNIITMMYDDIAHSKSNPTPGVIINIPGGVNVYSNITIDYKHSDVNKNNFMGVLKGDPSLKAKGKKVLASGPNDHVFVYFSDHGGTGVLCFPRNVITSAELNSTLQWMKNNNRFAAMTLYIEACESGSMFKNILPEDESIFAVTASKPDESSYAIYFDEERETYLADEFSINWLIDSDTEKSLVNETIEKQFIIVRSKTKQSTPQQFGDHNVRRLSVSQFQGDENADHSLFNSIPDTVTDSISNINAPIESLRRSILKRTDPIEKAALTAHLGTILAGRDYVNTTIRSIIGKLCQKGYCTDVDDIMETRVPLTNHQAYSELALQFHKSCFSLSTHRHTLSYLYAFANIIEDLTIRDKDKLNTIPLALKLICKRYVGDHRFKAII